MEAGVEEGWIRATFLKSHGQMGMVGYGGESLTPGVNRRREGRRSDRCGEKLSLGMLRVTSPGATGENGVVQCRMERRSSLLSAVPKAVASVTSLGPPPPPP